MGKLKQLMIDSELDLSDDEHNRVITMWNEKAELKTVTTVTAKQYAQNAVISVAILALIAIFSSKVKPEVQEVPIKPVVTETHSDAARYNDYHFTNFRYSGTILHIDKSPTEKM